MPFVPENGILVWKPSQRQEDFLTVPDSVFEAFYGGAAGGGKSELLLMLPVLRGFYKIRGFNGIIFRKSFPQLEESLIPKSKDMYPHFGGRYNETKHFWTFPEFGTYIRFGYMEEDRDAQAHDTAEFNYLGFDELTHFSRYQYTYLTSRVRSARKDLPAIVRSASNPGNIGHIWVRERFVEPNPKGYTILRDPVSNSKRIFIPAKAQDNPHIMKEDPGYVQRLSLLPEAERRAKAEGDWWTFSGQVFTEFRPEKLSDEPKNAIHVCESFEIPDWWPKFLAIDWGFAHKTWAGLAAMSPDGRLFLYRELVRQKSYVEEWAADLARMIQFEGSIARKVIDPSAQQNRGQLKTIYQQVIDATGWSDLELADNDRIGGKLLVHSFLRWKERPPRYIPREGYNQEVADRVYRMHGQKALDQYRTMFLPDPPELNVPRLQIFNTCQEVIKTLSLCIYDESKTEDVKKFDGDDAYDGLRYLLKAADGYEKQSKAEADSRAKLGKIVDRFKVTGDVNSFYRQMEHYEAKKSTVPIIVRGKGVRGLVRK